MPPVIASALVKVQSKLKPLMKSETNTEYNSSFVPLDVVTEKAIDLLGKHGVAVIQPPVTDENDHLALETSLVHESGVGFSKTTRLALSKADPQGHGAAITYMRRYALMGMLGMTAKDEDDDGNLAAGIQPKPTAEQVDEITGMLRHLKWPKEQIDKEVARAKTRSQAQLMIANYRKVVNDKVGNLEDTKKIEVTDDDYQDPLKKLEQRIKGLKLVSKSYENKIVKQATGRPFLSAIKTGEDMEKLDKFLTFLEGGDHHLPAEFYAPTADEQIVEEDVA